MEGWNKNYIILTPIPGAGVHIRHPGSPQGWKQQWQGPQNPILGLHHELAITWPKRWLQAIHVNPAWVLRTQKPLWFCWIPGGISWHIPGLEGNPDSALIVTDWRVWTSGLTLMESQGPLQQFESPQKNSHKCAHSWYTIKSIHSHQVNNPWCGQ